MLVALKFVRSLSLTVSPFIDSAFEAPRVSPYKVFILFRLRFLLPVNIHLKWVSLVLVLNEKTECSGLFLCCG